MTSKQELEQLRQALRQELSTIVRYEHCAGFTEDEALRQQCRSYADLHRKRFCALQEQMKENQDR